MYEIPQAETLLLPGLELKVSIERVAYRVLIQECLFRKKPARKKVMDSCKNLYATSQL
jgi:hypothetical protein